MVHVLLDRVLARAAPRAQRVERSVSGEVRSGVGQAPRGDIRAPEAAGRDPAGCRATPRPEALPAWDSVSENERRLYARQMEVYAGYAENCDWNVGRLLDAIEQIGELDDTLVIYIFGDNGASLEGTVTGSFNELTFQNGLAFTLEQQLSLIEQYGGVDAWGTDATRRTMPPRGRGPVMHRSNGESRSRPTSAGRATRWSSRGPDGSSTAGGLRTQFTHCIDVGPTILEAAGLPQPTSVDGTTQKPMEGTSFLYTFGDADAAERHTVQYFEIYGNRAIYKDGWWAACRLDRIPWDATQGALAKLAPGAYDPEHDTWELYYLPDDFSQAHDLAAAHPEKLAELKELFWVQAANHNVLPLLAGFSVFFGMLPRCQPRPSRPSTATCRTSPPA